MVFLPLRWLIQLQLRRLQDWGRDGPGRVVMCVCACCGGQEGKAGEVEEETGSAPSWREAQTKLLQAEKANVNLRDREYTWASVIHQHS